MIQTVMQSLAQQEIVTINDTIGQTPIILPLFKSLGNFLNSIFPYTAFIAMIGTAIKIGKFQKKVDNLADNINKISPVVSRLNSCVQEIQITLKSSFQSLAFDKETIDLYGVTNSPIVLKDEFRDYLQISGLTQQIENTKEKIIFWLKNKNPQTGLDAQDMIMNLVLSDGIEKYLDVREFKKVLYEDGKVLKDAYFILAIYLFEVIIPEVVTDE